MITAVLSPEQIAPHLEQAQLLGIKLLNVEDFLSLVLRFFLNLAVTATMVKVLYSRRRRRLDFVFTFFLISTAVFLLCYLLEGVKLELGFALGLFAVFGIIRYRTDPVPIKEMTGLFVIITVAVMNALSNKKVSYAELVFANCAILGALAFLELFSPRQKVATQHVTYERIELIVPERRQELLADLCARTGLDVRSVEIESVNFVRDTAELILEYFPPHHPDHVDATSRPGST